MRRCSTIGSDSARKLVSPRPAEQRWITIDKLGIPRSKSERNLLPCTSSNPFAQGSLQFPPMGHRCGPRRRFRQQGLLSSIAYAESGSHRRARHLFAPARRLLALDSGFGCRRVNRNRSVYTRPGPYGLRWAPLRPMIIVPTLLPLRHLAPSCNRSRVSTNASQCFG
jgi:hypothetical protein